jgi:diaminopimelate decarboxylase
MSAAAGVVEKALPLPEGLLAELAREHGTPLYVYDLGTMRARLAELGGFDVVRYALKANSNLSVLDALRASGARADAVSAGEIVRALAAGFRPEDIVFSADLFEPAALALVARHGLRVNAGSRGMLAELARARPGAAVTLRLNPGFGSGFGPAVKAGGERSKHGIWHAELEETLAEARSLGLQVDGLHVHVGSGIDLAEVLAHTTRALADLARRASPAIRTLSSGGGLPIPYRAGEARPDVAAYVNEWNRMRRDLERELGRSLVLETEPGRWLAAEAGVLVTSVRATKRIADHEIVLVDAGFHTLLRPAFYGAWHEIRALGHANEPRTPRVVAGPLCEPGDVFTLLRGAFDPRPLPVLRPGDLLVILDAGAYGASMASNYNSHPLPAEVVVDEHGPRLARPRQTLEELYASELACLRAARSASSSERGA